MKCCGAQPEFTQMRCLRSLSEAHIYFMLKNQVAVEILAKYAHNVLEIYKGKDIYIVTQSVYENDAVWAPLPVEKAIDNML